VNAHHEYPRLAHEFLPSPVDAATCKCGAPKGHHLAARTLRIVQSAEFSAEQKALCAECGHAAIQHAVTNCSAFSCHCPGFVVSAARVAS
jgi:hypothetical protein